jgi:hypothetical protein
VGELEHVRADKRLLYALVILVLLLVAFSILVFFAYNAKPNEKFWDWLVAVVGTVFSFGLGLTAGLYHLNRQVAHSQESRKKKLCHLLIVELGENLKALEENLEALRGSDSNKRPTLTSIHPLVVEEAVKSGLFDHALTENMLKLAKTYRKYNDHLPTLNATGKQGAETKDTDGILEEAETKTTEVCTEVRSACNELDQKQLGNTENVEPQ